MLVVYGVLTRKRKTENTRSCSKLCLRGYLQGMFARQPWNKSSMTVPIQSNRSLVMLFPGGAVIWFLEKLNDSEQTRIAHPATILPLVGQKLHVSTLACINFENKFKNKI